MREFIRAIAEPFFCAFVVSGMLVGVTVMICRNHGWVATPRADRWHKGTPCLYGGVPIWLCCVGVSLVLLPLSNHILWRVVLVSSVVFLLGLADDLVRLSPAIKLAGQSVAAGLIVGSGVSYPLSHHHGVNGAVSVIWIVGLTNAINLLDNMDGLASGVALISLCYLGAFYASGGLLEYATLAIIAAGACMGFLLFNLNPARIFMGDSGSLFLGFLLGTLSVLEVTHVSGVPTFILAPVVVLAVPLFDTVFVSVTRRLRGQAVSQGGTDHSSHRLVHLGLNEREAVWLLYGLSAVSGAVALASRHVFYSEAVGLTGFWFLFLLLFGIHLFDPETIGAQGRHSPQNPFLRRLLTRDTLALLLDPVAISLAYYSAYELRFGSDVPKGDMALFRQSWPLVLAVKCLSLWGCRVYKHSWWRGAVVDLYRVATAVGIGEGLIVLFLMGVYRFVGFSRIVFAFDALLSLLVLVGVRQSFWLFRNSISALKPKNEMVQRRVLVLGTSERAELALRYLQDLQIACVGLVDTNGGADQGRWVWGTQVVGKLDDLSRLRDQHGVSEIVLPEKEQLPYSDAELCAFCEGAHLQLTKLGLHAVTDIERQVERQDRKPTP